MVLLLTTFAAATAQNSIDNLVDKYSTTGSSKFTSAVERNPKTRAVVKVVKVLEISGWLDIRPFINAFKNEARTGDFTERHDDDDLVMMLTTKSDSRNRIYMLKAQGGYTGSKGRRYEYTKITIIVKYR